jgi:hypothetical protein
VTTIKARRGVDTDQSDETARRAKTQHEGGAHCWTPDEIYKSLFANCQEPSCSLRLAFGNLGYILGAYPVEGVVFQGQGDG